MTVFLSLGSNIGRRADNLRFAIEELSRSLSGIRLSRIYRTQAYGVTNQPDFINLALQAECSLSPQELLSEIARIELQAGRKRTLRWGPRTLDIDILFYGDHVMHTPDLTLPHPDLQNRDFVLLPMMDLAPEWFHPVLKKTIRELYGELQRKG